MRTVTWILVIICVLFRSLWMLIPIVLLCFANYIAKRILEFDYEYILTNDELDIDMVMGGISRRNMQLLTLTNVILIAPLDHPELEPYDDIRVIDYSARSYRDKPYVMVCVIKDKRARLHLQLNEKMLKALNQMIPSKVIME